jgi:type IV secretion system protein TrbI
MDADQPRDVRIAREEYMSGIDNNDHDQVRARPVLQNPAGKPTGVVPRNAQTIMIVAISVVMVAAIALSGPSNRPPPKRALLPAPGVADPNQTRIAEYRSRLDEEARKLAAEQAQVLEARRQFANASAGPGPGPSPAERTDLSSGNEENSIESDRKRRAYLSLFASNVALSYRKDNNLKTSEALSSSENPLPTPAGNASSVLPPYISRPAFGEPLAPAERPANQVADSVAPAEVDDAGMAAGRHRQDPNAELGRSQGRKYRLFEGAVLEAVLTNRLNSSFSGPVNCMLTTNVYSLDRQHLLIPQGSRVLGEAKRLTMLGQERLAVVFHRLIMPDGFSLDLDKFEGLNQIGETGLQDQVNHHYGQVFGMSLAIGAIAGFAQANNNTGVFQSSTDAYREGVAASLSQSSLHILDRYLNILPTVTIREGHRIKIYLVDDLLVPAFDAHLMPENL